MTGRLKIIFTLILLTILSGTIWASLQMPFWKTPQAVVTHPWFIATLIDCYLGFFTFWLWVVYKEASVIRAGIWLVLIFAFGNIAMATYALITLWRLPAGAPIEAFLLRRK